MGFAVLGGSPALLAGASRADAQPGPLTPVREYGQGVTPAFEGWYRNPDGTFSLSFGYYNRNSKESLEIPVGARNAISPGPANQGQPGFFLPRRHWGVFAVTVPADFGTQKAVWTLIVESDTFAIPGSLKAGWEIDALAGEAGSGNTPPVLRFSPTGPGGSGPRGLTTGPVSATVGAPMTLTVWASDDGKAVGSIASAGRSGVPVTLTWFKHQGPVGDNVQFADATPDIGREDGRATTSVTFTQPGEYILRVRANDASGVENAGHAQCCWSNGFVRVKVSP